MSPLANKAELDITLGMVNYLSRFALNLAKVCAPLGCLLRGETKFKLDKTHERPFWQMEEVVTAELGPVLAYFDPEKEVTLQADTPKNGLGATIMHEGRPVAYAAPLLQDHRG